MLAGKGRRNRWIPGADGAASGAVVYFFASQQAVISAAHRFHRRPTMRTVRAAHEFRDVAPISRTTALSICNALGDGCVL